jgi:cadmium resistance protein CadD (predicted permease)
MKLATLADVRVLMQHLPDGHRQRSTWRYVKAQVADAASGGDIVGAYIPLFLVLMLERVECRLR